MNKLDLLDHLRSRLIDLVPAGTLDTVIYEIRAKYGGEKVYIHNLHNRTEVILKMKYEGLSSRQIAEKLCITMQTVNFHLREAKKKGNS